MQKLIVIAGPTAVGKSAVALELAKQRQGEIVSADSVQVYRGLDIGSAKPSAAERALIPHHLLDIRDPQDTYTAADFQADARTAIKQIHQRGKIPILVGGTGLYLRAVVWGFAFSKSGINPELRNKLRKLAEMEGPEYLHRQLKAVDPESARKLHPNDLRRVIRALEVYAQNRRPISEQVQKTPTQPVYDAAQFVLTRSRESLYRRIEARVDAMLEAGLIREVQTLLAKGVPPETKAMQSLGYKQIVAYLTGRLTLPEAVEQIKRETRRFAKRQLTWFRKEKEMQWLNIDGMTVKQVVEKISTALAGNY